MQLCFFEEAGLSHFHPLTLTRPLDDLRVGIMTISQKWENALGTSTSNRIIRPELAGVFDSGQIDPQENCIWINSRYLPTGDLIKKINDLSVGQCLNKNDTVIAANVDGKSSSEWFNGGSPDFNTLFVLESQGFTSITHVWDLIQLNASEIVRDLDLLQPDGNTNTSISKNAVLENSDNIYIQDGATIEAGAVLNANKGPIYIGKNATVMSGAQIRGPVAICEGSIIKLGARIYEGTTIGPVCKVGGEVSKTVFHSYSNKAHDGYLGNSLVGQWCNFGAGTSVSNLKTNYSTIRLADWITNEERDTGLQFLGIIMGDHSKTAINCVINSGTICGVSCNILSRDFPPKLIPSFSWVGSNVIQPYKLEKGLKTMGIMMARRDIEITEDYQEMMKTISENSRHPSS
jgi:UDP-N-acetylglucosamine diphosphorylase/glucosamine-1-phosphate N-acetyltransferase